MLRRRRCAFFGTLHQIALHETALMGHAFIENSGNSIITPAQGFSFALAGEQAAIHFLCALEEAYVAAAARQLDNYCNQLASDIQGAGS